MIRMPSIRRIAFAVAIAILVAPIAHSGGKPTVSIGRAMPSPPRQAALPPQYDRFIISYRSSGRATAAGHRRHLSQAAKTLGIGIAPLRSLATGGAVVRIDRKLDRNAVKRLVQELSKDPNVRAVEPDIRLQRAFAPNDPLYAQQWHYRDGPGGINLQPAWDIARGEGIVVAVLDTGHTDHSDLDANTVAGYDFISDPEISNDGDGRDADAHDPGDYVGSTPSSWHGTHVAGTIAAVTDNGSGVAGVAFAAKVQPVRVLGAGGGYLSDILEAIVWASGGDVAGVPSNGNPAEVINMSLSGGGACPTELQQAIDDAIARGTTIVASAGNSAADAIDATPANCEGVIAVSATTPNGALANYSNFGDVVDLAAPGGTGAEPAEDNVLSTYNLGQTAPAGESYAWLAGTSMAAPHVAGVVALIQSAAQTPQTPAQVKKILENTAYASNGYPVGCHNERGCGAGIVDARHAVAVASGAEPLPPDPPAPPVQPALELENGVTIAGIEVQDRSSVLFQLDVPDGASSLLFAISGGTGDADLYVRRGERPTDSAYDCRPFASGNNETCFFPNPQSGIWYVKIKGYVTASGISLYPSFVDADHPRELEGTVKQLIKNRTLVSLKWDDGKQQIDVYRNDAILTTRSNLGAFRDSFRIVGSGTMRYKVCNHGTSECSNEIEARYESPPP